jgi:hypothetical protein
MPCGLLPVMSITATRPTQGERVIAWTRGREWHATDAFRFNDDFYGHGGKMIPAPTHYALLPTKERRCRPSR